MTTRRAGFILGIGTLHPIEKRKKLINDGGSGAHAIDQKMEVDSATGQHLVLRGQSRGLYTDETETYTRTVDTQDKNTRESSGSDTRGGRRGQ